MNRCSPLSTRTLLRTLCLVWLACALAWPALAQTGLRKFPKQALRGNLVVTAPPRVELDGQTARLAPGARIHNTNNLLVLSGTLRGRELVVNYLRERNGLISEVWILTPREAEEERASAPTGRNYSFGFESRSPSDPINR